MNKLLSIDAGKKMPIYIQIVDSILDAIRRGNYKKGERIYSINELSNEYFLARDTVQKAYHILHQKGAITSIRGKGYYVRNTNVHVPFRVLLLFTRMSNYKKQIYNSFVRTMGAKAVVDIKFHHFDTDILRSLVENQCEYNYFVIMPHFYEQAEEALKIIRGIHSDQLLILDKISSCADLKCAAVYQDFANDICGALEQGIDLLEKYNRIVLVFPATRSYPVEIVSGFRKFCMQNNFAFEIITEVSDETPLKAGEAYIVIDEDELANLIRRSRDIGLEIGRSLGILSYNDSPLKEILLDGITVISTDHSKMGETAARLILENRREQIKNPFSLIRRRSL